MNATWLYVGVLYALAVLIARRLRADFPWRIAAFFYALVLIYLFRPMTGPYVNLPVDILTNLAPWHGVLKYQRVHNSELNDLVMQIIPWAHQVRAALLSGHLPLWNPLSASGYPLLASAQSSALSPLRLLALPLPLGQAFTAEAAMKILIALSFMYGFCRRRWSELASAIGAVCFAFCTFVQVWLHFPLASAAVWIPMAIVSLDLVLEKASGRRIAGVAFAWGTMLLLGHPETVAHTAFIGSLFILWVLVVERRMALRDVMQRVAALSIAMTLAALIASPFLATFAESIRKSKRYQELQVRPNEIGYFSDWPSVIILFQPHFFGRLPEEKAWPQAAAESITAFAGVLGAGAWLALLVHAIVERRWRDRHMFFVYATPVIVGIILAWPVIGAGFHLMFRFAANARLRLLLCWAIAAMAAAVVDVALADDARRVPGRVYLLIASGTSGLALLLLLKLVHMPPVLREMALYYALPSILVVATSLLVMIPRWRTIGVCVMFAAIIAETWSATRTWNPVLPEGLMYPSTPLIRFLQRGAPSALYRNVGIGSMFFPNTNAMYGLAEIRAHDPMALGRYIGVLRAIASYETDDYFAKWTNSETALLDYLNVRYIVAEPGAKLENTRHHLVYEGKDGIVYENPTVLPRFFPVRNILLEFKQDRFVAQLLRHESWSHTAIVNTLPVDNDQMRQDFLRPRPRNSPEATLKMVSATDTDYTMKVRAPRYSMVVSSIPFAAGWRVEQNGKVIRSRPVNGSFLGYTVPPGEWTVRVYYRPTLFYAGALVSLLAIAATFLLFRRDFEIRAGVS
jgi:hypothetical protein